MVVFSFVNASLLERLAMRAVITNANRPIQIEHNLYA